MEANDSQQLLERLASLLRSESRKLLFEFGLQPVHFEALHYLSICNQYSDTPMAVTEYLGQTKGSVSQTLKVLEKKRLLDKTTDVSDKRVTHMAITKKGRKLIDKVLPSPALDMAGGQLTQSELVKINNALRTLLNSMQRANGRKSFGQCSGCRYNIKNGVNDFLCGLTEEPLSTALLICREHELG
jgi:DNA-binding MarR family transcriptional regulator